MIRLGRGSEQKDSQLFKDFHPALRKETPLLQKKKFVAIIGIPHTKVGRRQRAGKQKKEVGRKGERIM